MKIIASGSFGENFTTQGVDVNGALIGERWTIGADVVLEVTSPRVPCGTFRGWMGIPGWLKIFAAAAIPGAYLRVIERGTVSAGDGIAVSHRPEHYVTVSVMFRALTLEPDLIPSVVAAMSVAAGTNAMTGEDLSFSNEPERT